MNHEIPAIDIAPFLTGDPKGKAQVVAQVASAAETIGFIVLSGHGIPQSLIEKAFEQGFQFFDLPDEKKAEWHPFGSAKQRGYHGLSLIHI